MSWAMETYLRTELVLKALDMALGQRRPAGADRCDPAQPLHLAAVG